MKKALKLITKSVLFFFPAAALFLNLGGWLAGLWVHPALAIALAFILITPLLTLGFYFLWSKFRNSFSGIKRRRLVALVLFSLLPAIILVLAFPHRFSSTILITPEISGDEEITLLELKADGHIVPVENVATDYGWQAEGNGVNASADSRPLLVKINTRAGAPVTFIFRTSPRGGSALVQHNRTQERIDLFSEAPGQTLHTFRANFRGLSNWLFLPVVVGADVLAYFLYALIILLLQEKGQQTPARKPAEEKFLSHRVGLTILISVSAVLHLINALSVPLIFGADSPSLIRGAFHLVENGNFGGVSQIRGPGTTLLFAPAVALFGRNPWGIKILLHILALSLVPLSYCIGWQLSGRRRVAFLAGLAAVLMPDLYFFSNFLMSDLPNLVIVSAFTSLLLSAFQTGQKRWIFGALLAASLGALLRSENLVLLALGAFTLAAQPIWAWITGEDKPAAGKKIRQRLLIVSLSLLIALLPALWWSNENYRNYGIFGLGNYAGEVFYTGWIYYAEGSGYRFTAQESPAVQAIQAAVDEFPIERMNAAGVPTGWNLYPSLIKSGYSASEAFALMTDAVWDSIRSNPRMAREVLIVKLKDGLTPVPTQMKTFHLSGEQAPDETLKSAFFDSETLRLPSVIRLQRGIYNILKVFFNRAYPLLVWIGLIAAYFCLLRKPELTWWTLAAIALTRIFIPDIMGKSDWRYTLSGMVLLQAMTVLWVITVLQGIKRVISKEKLKKS